MSSNVILPSPILFSFDVVLCASNLPDVCVSMAMYLLSLHNILV
jgi:hypothetical protein